MNDAILTYRQALSAYEDSQIAVARLAADHIDRHDELDETGEWERMRGLFGYDHRRSWDIEFDYETVTLHKTTARGLVDHTITVNLNEI